jgi:hypothetical protein
VLEKQFLPQAGLSSAQAFAVIISLMILTFGIAGIGVIAWLISRTAPPRTPIPAPTLGVLGSLIVILLLANVYIYVAAPTKPDAAPVVTAGNSSNQPSPSSTDCRSLPSGSDIDGTWWSAGNNATMKITRTGCNFSSSFGEAPAPHHELVGEYKDGRINYTVSRTDLDPKSQYYNCTVIFYGYFSNITHFQMTSNVSRNIRRLWFC